MKKTRAGFTIVELVVVIVVIAILAAITVVAYNGITRNAIIATMKNDIQQAVSGLETGKTERKRYSVSLETDGIKASGDNVFRFTSTASTFCITVSNSRVSPTNFYATNESMNPTEGTCPGDSPTNVIWTDVAVGRSISCGVSSAGKAYCWGVSGTIGLLGNGDTARRDVPTAVSTSGVLSGKRVTTISASEDTACVLTTEGKAYCWGSNASGQLGNNSSTDSSTPVAVTTSGVLSGETLTGISVTTSRVCAVSQNGNAFCWGNNTNGQLGNGTTTNSSVPVKVLTANIPTGVGIASISTGQYHTCVVGTDKNAYCWGYNSYGNVGDSTTTNSTSPIPVLLSTGVLKPNAIASLTNGRYATYVIGNDGDFYCWGATLCPLTTSTPIKPTFVGLSGVALKQVATYGVESGAVCAISSTGAGYCWGNNGAALGAGTSSPSSTPAALSIADGLAGRTLKELAVGYLHSCALTNSGTIACWGYDDDDALGLGASGASTFTPKQISEPAAL